MGNYTSGRIADVAAGSAVAGAPGRNEEIEITPEMIEAGVEAMSKHYYPHVEDDPWEEQVVSIYLAMDKLKPSQAYRKK